MSDPLDIHTDKILKYIRESTYVEWKSEIKTGWV